MCFSSLHALSFCRLVSDINSFLVHSIENTNVYNMQYHIANTRGDSNQNDAWL